MGRRREPRKKKRVPLEVDWHLKNCRKNNQPYCGKRSASSEIEKKKCTVTMGIPRAGTN